MHNANKHHHDQGGHTLATATLQPTNIPDEENMLSFNQINFSPLVIKAMGLLALAKMATPSNNEIAGSASGPLDPATFFDSLPTELLIQIIEELEREDQIRAAFIYPHLFMNDNRLNIFTADAYYQLNMRTYSLYNTLSREAWVDRLRTLRNPLIFDAILPESGSFGVDELDIILKQYEKVCIDNQIDPQAFLNSAFPDNRPANAPPPSNGPYTLDLMSPLHGAVEAGRMDIVEYLIQRGADVNRQWYCWRAEGLVTPFEYGLQFRAFFRNIGVSQSRIRQIDEIIERLLYTSTAAAFTADFHATDELNTAIFAGMDHLVFLLLQRFENLVNDNRGSREHQAVRNSVLQSVLTSDFPMPQSIRFMLDHGGNFSFINRRVTESVTEATVPSGIEDNMVCALQWELETEAVELPFAIGAIAALATRDAALDMLRPLAREFIRHNHYRGQARLLGYSIIAGTDAPLTREFLLSAVRDEVLNGEALRVAIRHGDRNTAARIIQSIRLRGQSIDEPVPMEQGVTNISHWYNTPLTYALAQENYYEAATLLSIGADPNQIPPNIRHRVRVVRDRINAGYIADIAFFVFRRRNLDAYPVPIVREAEWALNYVFTRLLDDPRYPMPNYVRTRRNEDVPNDHPANDSGREDHPDDDPMLGGVYPA
ncbi:hypothetical protein F4782DRAFT_544609 [Xylaria castorea]|nr:hypothetical protein F4782DRAFT_544609 [Xylaria castorea]